MGPRSTGGASPARPEGQQGRQHTEGLGRSRVRAPALTPPLVPAHAGGSEQRSMWRSGERGERARAVQAATSTLLATKPGLRSCACQPASAASHGGSCRPPRCRGAVSAWSLPSLDGAGLAVSDPLASSSASPEVWARPAPPCGVPTCFGSALQPVPGGWPGPCSPSLPSVVARVKCVLRPV